MSIESNILHLVEKQTAQGKQAERYYRTVDMAGHALYWEGWKHRGGAIAFALQNGGVMEALDDAAREYIEYLEKENSKLNRQLRTIRKESKPARDELNYWKVVGLHSQGKKVRLKQGGYYIKHGGEFLQLFKCNLPAFKDLGILDNVQKDKTADLAFAGDANDNQNHTAK